MNHHIRWRPRALVSAVALLVSLAGIDAHAFALGRITVQSLLGEALRAEVEIAEINADEASSLRANVASAEAFKAAGLEYSTAVIGMQISLQTRSDGRSFLLLSSARAVTEPFVDLILEASWSSGRVVRDYTMLFDPPTSRQAAPLAPAAPIVSPSVAPKASTARAPTASSQRVDVKKGDTAGKIAAQNKAANVSLDQMLIALLRRNPDAFIGGNVNRLKSGAVLDIPDADQAASMSTAEASRSVVAQSRDFNTFRRKLADNVPATQVANTNRQSDGKVQAKVEDRAPAAAVPDKLTLSKGAVQATAAAEEKIARERQAKEASDRVAELAKNIRDLNKITAPTTAASTGKTLGIVVPAPSPLQAPVIASSAPASAAKTAASAPSGLANTTTAASEAQAIAITANTPASAAKEVASAAAAGLIKKPVVTPPAPAELSLIDELTENPLMLGGIAALLMLLGALGFYRLRRRRNNAGQVDSSFLESRLQPDSFFGASGGKRIDTNESSVAGSSLVYSPSQLDASGDVDPVAEADVYLAYGRDLQAEEILKEAMRTNPARVAIHSKLMEIYAKRRDVKAFQVVALDAFKLTHGNGPDWAYISEMGHALDPANPMYQTGGRPVSAAAATITDDPFIPASAAFGPSTLTLRTDSPPEVAPTPVDFDLDLDFSVRDERKTAATPVTALAATASSYRTEPTVAVKIPKDPIFNGLEMDFSAEMAALKPTRADELAAARHGPAGGLSFTGSPAPLPAKLGPVATSAAAHSDSDMLEFDLGSLSLDLDSPSIENPRPVDAARNAVFGDPLETKFALAEEFHALGDADGARSLAEEVVAQASGSLKVRAQAFINGL